MKQDAPPIANVHPWKWPKTPWYRVHIDHAGEFMGKYFLVVIDAHSKWMEVEIVLNTSTAATLMCSGSRMGAEYSQYMDYL